ncbi:hypothetical protein K440DRAFT_657902 [Wilcoxina mikolae CBS 423.85]|nr:hypothetical protein K440DRAFT_657902 [Wilcoxina mikolae CBS 423.85]
MTLNQPLLLAAVLGLTSTLYITWKIVWVMMLAVSLAQLYLALPTSHDAATIAVRTVILRIFALAWLANGIVFVKGVGVRELPPWISIACSALVWVGSLGRFNSCDVSPKAMDVAVIEEPQDEGPESSQHKKRTHRGKRGGKKSKGAKKAGQDIDEAGE